MSGPRALVLGSGGLTGLAWEAGVLGGLAEVGIELKPDLVVGTSAGALLGARLASDLPIEGVADQLRVAAGGVGPIGAANLVRLLAAQVHPSRRHALSWLGRRAARDWTRQKSEEWVQALAGDLAGAPWPASLVVVATHAESGRPAFLSARQAGDLAAAVAASCAIPGVFPGVRIDDRLLIDGGLRSPANIDVAGSADRILALAPLTGSVRPYRRPAEQAKQLRASGTRVVLLTPDAVARRAIGVDVVASSRVPAALAAGRAHGIRSAEEVSALWFE